MNSQSGQGCSSARTCGPKSGTFHESALKEGILSDDEFGDRWRQRRTLRHFTSELDECSRNCRHSSKEDGELVHHFCQRNVSRASVL